jgi:hypothetical protein
MTQQKKDTENVNKKPIIKQTFVEIPIETVPIAPPEFVLLPLPEFVPVNIETIKIDCQPIIYEIPVEKYKTTLINEPKEVTQNSLKNDTLSKKENLSHEQQLEIIETKTINELFEKETAQILNNISLKKEKLSYEQLLGITKPEPILKHYLNLLHKFDQEDEIIKTKNKAIKKFRKKHKINWEDAILKTIIFATIILLLFVIVAVIHTQILIHIK